jgi:general stress protein 26
MHLKAIITAVVNIIGVYVVKLIEEKARKDKLWKIEMTIPTQYTTAVDFDLAEIPHNYIKISEKHTLFNFYCATQKETIKVKEIVNQYGAKYFISETKNF